MPEPIFFNFRGLTALSIVVRWRAMLKACEGKNLIRTEHPRSDIRKRKSTRAFSSCGVRYCWSCAFSPFEGRPWLGYHRVLRGTSSRSASIVCILRTFEGARGLAPGWLCPWLLTMMLVGRNGGSSRKRLAATMKPLTCQPVEISRRAPRSK
jgi:hypothetical protein